MLQHTTMNYQGHQVTTHCGVPQGAITSPTLFNLYIDDLITALASASSKVLAFADDIAFFAKDLTELKRAMGTIERWSTRSGIEMNYEKSGIMAIRVDRRTPQFRASKICNVPVVSQYKYLGLVIDDCGDMKPLNQTLKAQMTAFKRQISMSWAYKVPSKVKLLAWNSLIRSKFMYGLYCVTMHSKRAVPTIKQFFYNSLKNMLQLKSKPRSETLFKITLGTDIETYIDLQAHKQMVQLLPASYDSSCAEQLSNAN